MNSPATQATPHRMRISSWLRSCLATDRRPVPPLLVACVPAGVLLAVIWLSVTPSGFHSVGDFIEYWSAFFLFGEGKNPYDPAVMLQYQQQYFPDFTTATMMWNPPWVLFFYLPVLHGDLSTAYHSWNAVCSIMFIVLSVGAWRIITGRWECLAPAIFGLSFFFPLWDHLAFGQSSIIFALAGIGLYYALIVRNDLLIGGCLAVFSIKPHVIYLVAIVILWEALRERRFRIFVGGAVTLGALAGGAYLLWPQSCSQWIYSLTHNAEGVVRPVDWVVGTLVGAVRLGLSKLFGPFYIVPMILVPGITAIVTLAGCIRNRAPIDWRAAYPSLLCWSLFTSAYGWLFDNTMLIPAHLAMWHAVETRFRVSPRILFIPAAVISIHMLCYATTFTADLSQHTFFFFPFVTWLGLRAATAADYPESDLLDPAPQQLSRTARWLLTAIVATLAAYAGLRYYQQRDHRACEWRRQHRMFSYRDFSAVDSDLDSPNKCLAVEAIRDIASFGGPARDAHGWLFQAAGNSNAALRASAAAALGDIGVYSTKVSAVLIHLLEDPEPLVRRAATEALSKLRCPPVPRGKFMSLLNETDPLTRLNTVRCLHQFADSEAVLRQALEALLADPNADVRAAAIDKAGERHYREMRGRLRPFLDDPSPALRRSAAAAARNLGANELTAELERRSSDPDPETALSIRWALEGLDPELTDPLRSTPQELLHLALNENFSRRVRAVGYLGESGSQFIPELIALLATEDTAIRQAAIASLGQLIAQPNEANDAFVLRALSDSNPRVRRGVLGALHQRQVSEEILSADGELADAVVKRAVDLLGDPDGEVQATAASALARFPTRNVELTLMWMLSHGPLSLPAAYEQMYAALGNLRNRTAEIFPVKAAGHDERVDAAAAFALSSRVALDAVEKNYLIELRKSARLGARAYARYALEHNGEALTSIREGALRQPAACWAVGGIIEGALTKRVLELQRRIKDGGETASLFTSAPLTSSDDNAFHPAPPVEARKFALLDDHSSLIREIVVDDAGAVLFAAPPAEGSSPAEYGSMEVHITGFELRRTDGRWAIAKVLHWTLPWYVSPAREYDSRRSDVWDALMREAVCAVSPKR